MNDGHGRNEAPDTTRPEPTIGHNQPDPFDGESIRARLTDEHQKIVVRVEELEASAERMPDVVINEAMASKFTDTGGFVMACRKAAAAARKAEKDSFWEGGKAVDAFFNTLIARLDKLKAQVQRPLTAYQLEKEAVERRRREAEAKAAEEEATRLAEEAKGDDDLDAAVIAEETANKAAKEATAPAADLSRSRGEYGTQSSLRKRWTHTVTHKGSIPLDQLREYFSDDAIDKAIRAFVRSGGRELAGVKIFEEAKSQF